MPVKLNVSCDQPACPVASTGECLEEYDPVTECPHYTSTGTDEEDEIDEDEPDEKIGGDGEQGAVFFSEPELHGPAVDEVLAAALTKVVVIAGRPDSGKTTLLATLVDKFHEGEYSGHLFAGSKTIAGFERRCFDARLVSGRDEATTQRTELEDVIRFLHLVVRDSDLTPAKPLLFADISGEVFEQMQLRIDEVRRQTYLRRADHFTLLVDTGRLIDNLKRQEEKSGSITLMRSLVQEGMLGKHTAVEVVFSRWDMAVDSASLDTVQRFAELIRQDVAREFQQAVGALSFFEVAARPPVGSNLNVGYGLEPLFLKWVEPVTLVQADVSHVTPLPRTLREYAELRRARRTADGGGNQ